MSSEDCRLCLSPTTSARRSMLEVKIYDVLQRVFPFEIKVQDDLPEYVCSECVTIILDFHEYSELVMKIQEKLLELSNAKKGSVSELDNTCSPVDQLQCKSTVQKKDDGEDASVIDRIQILDPEFKALEHGESLSDDAKQSHNTEYICEENGNGNDALSGKDHERCLGEPKSSISHDNSESEMGEFNKAEEIGEKNGGEDGGPIDQDHVERLKQPILNISLDNDSTMEELNSREEFRENNEKEGNILSNHNKNECLAVDEMDISLDDVPSATKELHNAEELREENMKQADTLSDEDDVECLEVPVPIVTLESDDSDVEVLTDERNKSEHVESKQSTAGGGPLDCNVCNATFETKYNLVKHKNQKHKPQNGSFRCYQCDSSFHTLNRLIYHKKVHTKQMCKICDKLVTKSVFNSHLAAHRGAHWCKMCGETFGQYSHLRIHQELMHNGQWKLFPDAAVKAEGVKTSTTPKTILNETAKVDLRNMANNN